MSEKYETNLASMQGWGTDFACSFMIVLDKNVIAIYQWLYQRFFHVGCSGPWPCIAPEIAVLSHDGCSLQFDSFDVYDLRTFYQLCGKK